MRMALRARVCASCVALTYLLVTAAAQGGNDDGDVLTLVDLDELPLDEVGLGCSVGCRLVSTRGNTAPDTVKCHVIVHDLSMHARVCVCVYGHICVHTVRTRITVKYQVRVCVCGHTCTAVNSRGQSFDD